MKSYSEKEVFTRRALHLLDDATSLVHAVDNFRNRPLIRCHELARAVHEVLRAGYKHLRVVDGKYGAVEHSWLTLNRGGTIPGICYLDVYAVGRLPQVQLVSVDGATMTLKLYEWGQQRTDIRRDVVQALTDKMMEARNWRLLAEETEI